VKTLPLVRAQLGGEVGGQGRRGDGVKLGGACAHPRRVLLGEQAGDAFVGQLQRVETLTLRRAVEGFGIEPELGQPRGVLGGEVELEAFPALAGEFHEAAAGFEQELDFALGEGGVLGVHDDLQIEPVDAGARVVGAHRHFESGAHRRLRQAGECRIALQLRAGGAGLLDPAGELLGKRLCHPAPPGVLERIPVEAQLCEQRQGRFRRGHLEFAQLGGEAGGQGHLLHPTLRFAPPHRSRLRPHGQ